MTRGNWQSIIKFKKIIVTVSLLRGRIQEIKRMALLNFTHGLFLTCTQKSHYIYRSFSAIFTRCTVLSCHPTPSFHLNKHPTLLTWRTSFFLVVTNTNPPMSLVCQQLPHPLPLPLSPFHTPQFKLQYLLR
jgi:hypothetical protein